MNHTLPSQPASSVVELPSPWQVNERISARARHIRVEIRGDGSVWLIIPRLTSRRAAYAFMDRRRDWIERTRQRMAAPRAQHQRAALAWDGHDRLPLRGREVALLRVASRMRRLRVRTLDDRIELLAPPAAPTRQLELALRTALRELARDEAARLLSCEATRLQVSWNGPRIADQRSRWGSCAASGLISLNWRLVMAPSEVLRYVVVHELCHRIHANHSSHFWNRVARQLPEYQTQRAWLRAHGASLHAVLPRQ